MYRNIVFHLNRQPPNYKIGHQPVLSAVHTIQQPKDASAQPLKNIPKQCMYGIWMYNGIWKYWHRFFTLG